MDLIRSELLGLFTRMINSAHRLKMCYVFDTPPANMPILKNIAVRLEDSSITYPCEGKPKLVGEVVFNDNTLPKDFVLRVDPETKEFDPTVWKTLIESRSLRGLLQILSTIRLMGPDLERNMVALAAGFNSPITQEELTLLNCIQKTSDVLDANGNPMPKVTARMTAEPLNDAVFQLITRDVIDELLKPSESFGVIPPPEVVAYIIQRMQSISFLRNINPSYQPTADSRREHLFQLMNMFEGNLSPEYYWFVVGLCKNAWLDAGAHDGIPPYNLEAAIRGRLMSKIFRALHEDRASNQNTTTPHFNLYRGTPVLKMIVDAMFISDWVQVEQLCLQL